MSWSGRGIRRAGTAGVREPGPLPGRGRGWVRRRSEAGVLRSRRRRPAGLCAKRGTPSSIRPGLPPAPPFRWRRCSPRVTCLRWRRWRWSTISRPRRLPLALAGRLRPPGASARCVGRLRFRAGRRFRVGKRVRALQRVRERRPAAAPVADQPGDRRRRRERDDEGDSPGGPAGLATGPIRSGTLWRMCDDHEHSAAEAAWTAPRAAEGPAVDPVTLPEVDEVAVTTMVDNTFDALLASGDGVSRTPMGAGTSPAGQFAGGETIAGSEPSTALRPGHGQERKNSSTLLSTPAPHRTRSR